MALIVTAIRVRLIKQSPWKTWIVSTLHCGEFVEHDTHSHYYQGKVTVSPCYTWKVSPLRCEEYAEQDTHCHHCQGENTEIVSMQDALVFML